MSDKKNPKKPPARLGRPPTGNAMEDRIMVRMTVDQRARMDAAAKRVGMTTGQWARAMLLIHAPAADVKPAGGYATLLAETLTIIQAMRGSAK